MDSHVYEVMCCYLSNELTCKRFGNDLIPLTESQIEKIITLHYDPIAAAAEKYLDEEDGNVYFQIEWIKEWCYVDGFTLYIDDQPFPFVPENFDELVRCSLINQIKWGLSKLTDSQIEKIIDSLPIDKIVRDYDSNTSIFNKYVVVKESSICINNVEYPILFD